MFSNVFLVNYKQIYDCFEKNMGSYPNVYLVNICLYFCNRMKPDFVREISEMFLWVLSNEFHNLDLME